MREEGGFLTISDKRKIHAIRLRNQQPLQEGEVWSYRVYLPEGQKYVIACQVNDLPTGNNAPDYGSKPNESILGSGKTSTSGGTGLLPGQYVFTVALGLGKDGKWRHSCQVMGKTSGGQHRTDQWSQDISPDSKTNWPAKIISSSTSGVIERQSQHNPKQNLILLNHRAMDGKPGSTSSASTEGIMLWIEPNSSEPGVESIDFGK